MEEQNQDFSWWSDQGIVHLISRVARSGGMEHLRRKIDKINAAVENGADVGRINEFVEGGNFNGHNVDELIEHAKYQE